MRHRSDIEPTSHCESGIPDTELQTRRDNLLAELDARDISSVMLTHPRDILYFAGAICNGVLIVSVSPPQAVMVVHRVGARIGQAVPFEVRELGRTADIADALRTSPAGRVGATLSRISAAQERQLRRASRQEELVDASHVVDNLRMRKSAWEIAQIEIAGEMARQAQDLAAQVIRDGASDLEAQLTVEYWLRRAGHPGLGHGAMENGASVVILAGADAAIPGYTNSALGGPGLSPAAPTGPRGHVPEPDESVVVDLLGYHNGYFADQTRTFATGALAPDLASAQSVCEEALDHTVAGLRAGVSAGELYQRSVDVVTDAGMLDFWMGAGGSAVRFVGHGIGSAVSEEPFIAPGHTTVLPEGAVIALEPKLVLPGRGAVGIEHTYALTADGPRRMTSD